MNTRHQPRPLAIAFVLFEQELASFFIKRGLRVRIDEQTFHGHEDVADTKRRLPVFL